MKRSTFSIVQNTQEIDSKTIENLRITKKDIEAALLTTFSLVPQNYMLSYVDPDGDEVIAEIEEDFAIAEATAENGEITFVVGLEEHFNYQLRNSALHGKQFQVVELKAQVPVSQEVSEVLEPMNIEKVSDQPVVEEIKVQEPSQAQPTMTQEEKAEKERLLRQTKEAKEKQKRETKAAKQAREKEKLEAKAAKQAREKEKLEAKAAKQAAKEVARQAKQKEKQEALEKKKKEKQQKPVKAKPEHQILSKEEIVDLIHKEVLKMVPQIKKQLKNESSSESESSSEEKVESQGKANVGQECTICHKKSLPYFINPKTKEVYCQKCEKHLKDESLLIKIRSNNDSQNIARINCFPVYNFNLKSKEADNRITYLTELRDLTLNQVKQVYNVQINELKEKQRMEQLVKKQQAQKKDAQKKKQLEEKKKLAEIERLNKEKARLALEQTKILQLEEKLKAQVPK